MKNPFYNQERIFFVKYIKKDVFSYKYTKLFKQKKKNQQKICGLKKFLYLRKIFRQKKNNV